MRHIAGHRLNRAVALLLFLALAGCSGRTPDPATSPTPTATSTPTPSPTPTGTPVPVTAWIRHVGSPAWDRGNTVGVDKEGNVIVSGAAQGPLPGQTLGGSWDAYAVKYGPDGTVVWTSQFTTGISIGALASAVDGSGNILLVGHVQGALPGQTNSGLDDAYVRKLAPTGTALWTSQFGSSETDSAFGVAADGSGNIVVAGGTHGALPGQTALGEEDAFVRKFSPEGAVIWTVQFGSSDLDGANGVVVDRDGNIIVAGATRGTLPGQTPVGSWDGYVRKLSPAGTELWTHQFGTNAPDAALGVAVDGSGNIIVVGHTMGILPGQTKSSYDDGFVRKLSPAGTEMWTRQFGSRDSTEATAVAADREGNIIVAGHAYGALPGQTAVGLDDAYVRKYSPEGTVIWTSQFGSPAADVAIAVAVDATNTVYAVGHTYGAMPGQSNLGDWDAFVIRIDQRFASGPGG